MTVEIARFLLELVAVVAVGIAGGAASWWLAVILPVTLIAVWARYVAPKSAHRLRDPSRLVAEMLIFAAVGVALSAAGHDAAGIVLASASAVVAALLRLLRSQV